MASSMRALRLLPVFAVCLVLCGTAVAKTKTKAKPKGKTKPGFTLKRAYVQIEAKRLVYSVVVCTKGKAKLSVTSSFTPVKKGVPTARPGATQYQSSGCWPAQVAASIKSHAASCKPLECPVVVKRDYNIRVKITNTATRKTVSAPAMTRKA
jgi:hypothetical protein